MTNSRRGFPVTNRSIWVVALTVHLLACSGTRPRVGLPATAPRAEAAGLAQTIDALSSSAIARGPNAGLSVAVMSGNRLLVSRGYGQSDVASGRPAAADTVYRIASLTKQFTAAAVMRLVEQHRLGLDDDITKYLPDYPTRGQHVSLRHLLTHTSGIHSYTDDEGFSRREATPMTSAELVGLFSSVPFDFSPGARWSYSDSNYVLLGLIIERVSGLAYRDFLAREVLARAGLHATGWCPDEPTAAAEARGYRVRGGKLEPATPIAMVNAAAAGALCSTVGDLARWTRALASGGVVSPASYREMITPARLNDGSHAAYGFGLFVSDLDRHVMISHRGGINGFVSELSYFPEQDLTIAVLVNTEGSAAHSITSKVARAALKLPEPTTRDLPLDRAALEAYVGTYEIPGAGKLEVTIKEGRLLAGSLGEKLSPFLYQGDDLFAGEAQPDTKLKFARRAGRCDQVTVEISGSAKLTGVRINSP